MFHRLKHFLIANLIHTQLQIFFISLPDSHDLGHEDSISYF